MEVMGRWVVPCRVGSSGGVDVGGVVRGDGTGLCEVICASKIAGMELMKELYVQENKE